MAERKVQKRFDIDRIRIDAGDAVADRILAMLMRAKCEKVIEVTVADIRNARKRVNGDVSQQTTAAFHRLARKWIMEDAVGNRGPRKAFLSFMSKLESKGKGTPRGKKKAKTSRKRASAR